MTHFTNGTKVQYRPNSEPYVFSRNPEAVRTICSIRLICDDESGRVTHSYAKLLGRTNEVFIHELMGVKDVIADGALPVAVSVPTVNKSQLRIKKIPLIAVTSLVMASFSLIFDQINTASPPSAPITAAVVLITLSQWSIVYLHFLLPKHLR